ncbi:MAG: alpha/beta hydrolase [Actinomycetota bacterium]|nr:alpha/beta hydrolase [Actinomycetota bacterium]
MLLAHEVHGSADDPALVLIHGITDSRHMWRPLLPALAAHHRVVAVDLRGHGESPTGDAYDPISYASDVVETAAAAGVHDAVVVGHSLGGVVASAYAAIAPCRAVMNVDQPLQLSSFKDALGMIEPMLKGDRESFDQALELMFGAMDGPLSASEQARLREHRRADQQVVLATWASVFDSTPAELDATVEALASAITVPYLSLHGMDPGPDYGAWLTRLVPTATVELWPDLGHYVQLVEPDRFLARLAEFEAAVR